MYRTWFAVWHYIPHHALVGNVAMELFYYLLKGKTWSAKEQLFYMTYRTWWRFMDVYFQHTSQAFQQYVYDIFSVNIFCTLWFLPVQVCESGKERAPPHGRSRKYLCFRNHRWQRWFCIGRNWWPPCGWPLALMMWWVQLPCHWGETLQRHKEEERRVSFNVQRDEMFPLF